MAFAEPQNQTSGVINTVSNDTVASMESLTVTSNETNSILPSNSTNYNLLVPVSNSTISNKTGSIIPENQTNFTAPTNQTVSDQTEPVPNYLSYDLSTGIVMSDGITILRNGTIPPIQAASAFSTNTSITDSLTILRNGIVPPANATSGLLTNLSIQDSINVIKSGITVPQAAASWNFTSTNDTIGKARVENNTLNLKGNGYLQEKVNSTNTLDNFTVSAWVKPDYSQGSPVFSVITKSGLFALDINNNITPAKAATFSIYDGIHWSTVNSTILIPENSWTYLAGTYNGTYITIYVNGTLQSSYKLQGVLSISDDGHLVPVNPDKISSNSDVVIGASVNTVHSAVTDKFSGQIKDVNFYSALLNQFQIQQIYMHAMQEVQSNSISSNVPMVEVVSVHDSIQVLLNPEINSTSINGTGINETRTNATALSIVPTITNLKSSYTIGDNPEFEFKIFKDSDIKKIKKTIKANMQHDGWNEKNTTITVKVIAPDGTEIPLKSEFKKMKEGKFDIKILSKKYGKPGLYTIKTIMRSEEHTYTTQNQYAWGLVSLNTQKSTYKPGEIANMTMVVLDSGGHPVCNANLSVTVTDPSSHITTLLSGVGISAGSECGLYHAQYTTTILGNYTVNVSATTNSIRTDFNTSFLVQNNIPFDIIRIAQSKIDPVNNPNLFNVKIDVESFVNPTTIVIKESVPSVLNVTTDASVQTVGDSKVLTWNKDLMGNKTSVQYSYTVPLVFPQLYALGPVQITYDNQTFVEARQWFVANDPASNPTSNSDTLIIIDKPSTGNNPKDTLALSDSPIVSHGSLHSVTVQDSLASQLSDKASTGTTPSDTLTVTDSVSIPTGTFYPVTVQDSLASQLSDKASTGTTPSDTVTVTDSVSIPTSTFYPVTVQDSLASQLSDKASTGTTPSDTVTVTELSTPMASKMVQISDSVSITDTLAKNSIKSLFESIGITDAMSKQASYNKSLSDSILTTDAIIKSAFKILNEQILISDSSTPFANLANNQQVVENATTQITVNPSTPQLVVVNNNTSLANVNVPSTVTSPSINYSAIKRTSGSVISVPIMNSLPVTKDTTGNTQPNIKLTIPTNTTISGTSWNAVLALPTVESSSSVSLPTTSGEVNTPQTVITIGSSTPLSFDKPVRLLFVGQAGLRTGFFHSTSVTEITSICTSDSVSGVPSGSNECKINVGADLVVWTKHFTGFATWSSSLSTPGSSSTGTGQAGGGGTGVGAATGVGASSTSNGGGEGPYLKIQNVSYDTCDKQIVMIQIATDKEVDPLVIIRTSITGVVNAKLVADQPYAQENINATIKKLVYEAAINPKETSFEVLAL